MFYYLPWVVLMTASLAASLVLMVWGFRNGQFSDQDRARYLPLRDSGLSGPTRRPAGKKVIEVYCLLGLIAGVGVALGVALVTAIVKAWGG